MKNQSKKLIIVSLLSCLTLLSCKKKSEENRCGQGPGYLFALNAVKWGTFSNSPTNDSADFDFNSHKSMTGLKTPSVEINGRSFSVSTNDVDHCIFEYSKNSIPYAQIPSYFTFGQNNTLKISGDVSGTVSEQFLTPKELKVTPPATKIVHRNSDLVINISGIDDFPLPLLPGADPLTDNDEISFGVFYERKWSDTLNYPTLPVQHVYMSTSYKKTDNGKMTIKSTDLKLLPLNGTALVRVFRGTQFTLTNRSKGGIYIDIDQSQFEYFTIKD